MIYLMPTPLTLVNGQIVLDETNRAAYRRLLAEEYARIWRMHPDVLEMHKRNRQFVRTADGIAGFEAARHTVAQALRGEALAVLLGLPLYQEYLLIKGILLTDAFKAEERRYMLAHGLTLQSYIDAQLLAHESWEQSGMFGSLVMRIGSSVAHESLVMMETIYAKPFYAQTWQEILFLAAHYLDDISLGSEWCRPALCGRNMIDFRTEANAANPAYQAINEAGAMWLRQQAVETWGPDTSYFGDGKTMYEYQAETGKRVERLLVALIEGATGNVVNPLRLPEALDTMVLTRFNLALALA